MNNLWIALSALALRGSGRAGANGQDLGGGAARHGPHFGDADVSGQRGQGRPVRYRLRRSVTAPAGDVQSVEILEAPDPAIGEAVRAALGQWKFPAMPRSFRRR